MNPSICVDPKVNLDSEESIEIIIKFKTNPAKIQVSHKNSNVTLDQAIQKVEESHVRFQNELESYLEKYHIEYVILHTYKEAFNGVTIKIQGKNINYLLKSNEIKAIYLNKTKSIPIKPNDPRYQI